MVNYRVSPPSPSIFFYPLPSRILKLQVIKSHRFWRTVTKTDDLRARLSASEYIKSSSNWYIQKTREGSKKQRDFVLCLLSSQVRIPRRLTETLNRFLAFENRGKLNPHCWVKPKKVARPQNSSHPERQRKIVKMVLWAMLWMSTSSPRTQITEIFSFKNVSGFSHKAIISRYQKWKSSTTSLLNLELWPWWSARSGSK